MNVQRLPDELMAADLIDSALITEMRRYYVDIDTTQGMNYAVSIYWDEGPKGDGGIPWPDRPEPKRQLPGPAPGARAINVVWDFHIERFKALFLHLMTKPMRAAPG